MVSNNVWVWSQLREANLPLGSVSPLALIVSSTWRINKRNNQIIFSAGNKPYPYQDYKFYYRDENLVGLYSNTNDKMVVLDILFAETENK